MPVESHELSIYQQVWSLIINDDEFRSVMGVKVGPNNQVRIDQGKVKAGKTTVATDGDLPELEIGRGELRDDGSAGVDDHDRPVFAVVQGDECDDPKVIQYDFGMTLTYPDDRFEEFFPLLEVIRRNLTGYKMRKAGLAYVGNVSFLATFEKAAEWRDTVRPQHQITLTVDVHKN